MAVTQKQIADKLQVSRSLVGRTLNGGGKVSADLKERILTTAREMGYDLSDNHEARGLIAQRYGRKIRTGTIAVAFALDTSLDKVPYYVSLLNGLEDEALQRGVSICLCPYRADGIPPLVRGRHVDGVIVLGETPWGEELEEIDLPIGFFHWKSERAQTVCPDDHQAGYDATRHLIESGHRRIGYLSFYYLPGRPWSERLAGYRDAMRDFGLPVKEEWIETGLGWPTYAPGRYCAGCDFCAACVGWPKLMEKNGGFRDPADLPFTALICHNDQVAMGAITQARKQDVLVPRDLSVIGFDNISSQYNFQPAVTSMSMPSYEMGRELVGLLLQAIENTGTPVYHHSVSPMALHIHDSTASPPK